MKKYISVLVAMGLFLALSSFAFAGTTPATGIVGSVHDLSSAGGGAAYGDNGEQGGLDRICIYCHAPHNTIKTGNAGWGQVSYYPLWNHAVSTILSYDTYTNGPDAPSSLIQHGLQAVLDGNNVKGVSRLCLSCHDGSVAPNVFGFNGASSTTTAATSRGPLTGGYQIGLGGDLSNHHPIGFDFASVLAVDDEIATPDTQFLGYNPTGLTIGEVLWNGKMECSTCHDVHNTKSQGTKFTWVSDEQSQLCLSCHLK